MNRGVHLTLMIGGAVAERVPQQVIEALSEVQVTAAASSQSGFQLKFTLGKRSYIAEQLLPSGYFDPQRRVIIVVTLNGSTHVLMDGVITKQDVAPSDEAGASTLTVTGLDLSAHMDFVDLSGLPYPALPPSVVVLLILAKYAAFGVVPKVIPSVIAAIDNPLDHYNKHSGTDLSYINYLARQVGHVFYLEPGPTPGMSTAYWGPETRFGSPQPVLTINMDGASNVESLTFSYDGLARRLYVVTILLEEVHVPIPIPLPTVTLLKPHLAEQPAVIMKTQNIGLSRFGAAEAARVGLALLSGSADAVTGSGQVNVVRYGSILKPRQLVAVRGATPGYDGLYYVNNVTHSIRRGEYTQSFSLARGGLNSTIERVSA